MVINAILAVCFGLAVMAACFVWQVPDAARELSMVLERRARALDAARAAYRRAWQEEV